MEEELKKLGLSDNEAKVYLAALSLGPTNANGLAKHGGIKRPSIYLALESLIKQGLIAETYINKKRLFQAEKPEKLEKLSKRMRRKAIEAEILLEELIPSLINLPKQNGEEPQVIFYSSVEGMRNILLEISASQSPWHFFGSTTRVLQSAARTEVLGLVEEGVKLRRKMDTKRPKIYFITDSGILSLRGGFENIKTSWREMKILPETINSSSGFIIYQDKMVVLNFEPKPFAAVIKSKEVVEVVKVMYQLIWKSLPEK